LCVVGLTCLRAARGCRLLDPWLSGALVALPLAWAGFLLVYSSAADYALMPLFVTALGCLLARADRLAGHGIVGGPVEDRRRAGDVRECHRDGRGVDHRGVVIATGGGGVGRGQLTVGDRGARRQRGDGY
jgi:hypothetical protein